MNLLKNNQPIFKKIFLLIILVSMFSFLLIFPFAENIDIGTGDFRPYWSASYLLSQGQDFSDPGLMDHIERTLTGWDKSFTMMAWFAPTGMVVLLPFTLLPFEKAALFWLLINILVLCITAILLWNKNNQKIWIPLLAIFTFPMTLLSLYVGQINILVLFGLAIYLSLEKPKYQYLRGVGLALTTIKSHLVILTLPLIILDSIYHKQWKLLVGFLGALFFSAIILFAFYPAWISSFWNLITSGMSTLRETPTISGLIVHTTGLGWGKWLWIPGLLITFIFWWIRNEETKLNFLVFFSIPLSLLISPIGWSYDQIMLLVPIFFIINLLRISNPAVISIEVSKIFLITNYFIIFILRIFTTNELWFFWVPVIVVLILHHSKPILKFKE